jgi:nucleoside-diphosphate-sugar epimerase
MSAEKRTLFLLGAGGFIGSCTAEEALRQGWNVIAVVRAPEKIKGLADRGVRAIEGDAARPAEWIEEAAGADVLIDLIQPKLPERIGVAEIERAAAERLAITERILEALKGIPEHLRPMLFSVSGLDDLVPDSKGQVSELSGLREAHRGFSYIGVPVRRLMEASGNDCAFLYLATVYGPGKAFAGSVFPKMAAGRFRMPGAGHNHMPLVHVEDTARALVHLAGLPKEQLAGRTIPIADRSAATMEQFFKEAARLMGVATPRATPLWLARLFAGRILCETLARDIAAETRTLNDTGFDFKYQTINDGLPPTLDRLGYRAGAHPPSGMPSRIDSPILLLTLFVVCLAAMICVNTIDFPASAAQLTRLSGGLPLLDMRFHYNAQEIVQLLEALGPVGRAACLRFYWTLDLVLPAMFGLTLWLAIGRTRLRKWRWLALAAAALDYAENISVTSLLLNFPLQSSAVAAAASAFTSCKWIFYAAAVLTALTGAGLGFISKRKRIKLTEPGAAQGR